MSNKESRIEITEMPTKELLEIFVTQLVMGTQVTVVFNSIEGKFIQDEV